MRTLSAARNDAGTGFFDQPRTEQAKVVGLAAAAVGVAAFWSLLLMAPAGPAASTPPPVVQQAPPQPLAQAG